MSKYTPSQYLDFYDHFLDQFHLPEGNGTGWGVCPFHPGDDCSMSVQPSSGDFYCHKCHAGGDIYEFLMELEHCDVDDAKQRVDGMLSHGFADDSDDADDARSRSRSDSCTQRLVDLALGSYDIGTSDEEEAFAVSRSGPRIARLLGSRRGLGSELAALHLERYHRVVGQSAVNDALLHLEGIAAQQPRTPLFLRYALVGEALWIDMGDATGRCIEVTADGWTIADRAPVIFKRTALTRPLPEPSRNSDLRKLESFLNVDWEGWKLVLGCLVSACLPDTEHPILILVGEQGSAKSTTARRLLEILDPSEVVERAMPRDLEGWVLTASASHVILLDNVSRLPDWLSDALCRAVTGEAFARRRLYSDSDLVVTRFKRQVFITGIELGKLAGDLLDRAVLVELPRLDGHYQSKRLLDQQFEEAMPVILGGLLDALSAVLKNRDSVVVSDARMADHARALLALDAWEGLGTGFYDVYKAASERTLAEAVDADPVAIAVVELMGGRREPWHGTMSDLLERLRPQDDNAALRYFPKTPQHLSNRLTRLAPNLREAGIEVVKERGQDRARQRFVTLHNVAPTSSAASASSERRALDAQLEELKNKPPKRF